jgi:hypothetical protein
LIGEKPILTNKVTYVNEISGNEIDVGCRVGGKIFFFVLLKGGIGPWTEKGDHETESTGGQDHRHAG